MFERPSSVIIGLERLILETIGFDFRSRYVQKYLVKATKTILGPSATKAFFKVAYDMGVDLHKTFAPIKQTTWTMALAIVELTALITGTGVEEVRRINPADWHTTRADIVETLLDLLDLYTQNNKSTKVGPAHDIKIFIDVKIDINNEVDNSRKLKRYPIWCDRCSTEDAPTGFTPAVTPCITPSFPTPGSATSPAAAGAPPPGTNPALKRGTRSQEGSMRFVFDMDDANEEKKAINSYLHEEYDDVMIDTVEAIPESERQPAARDRRHEAGWAPYPRGRDRRRGHRHH